MEVVSRIVSIIVITAVIGVAMEEGMAQVRLDVPIQPSQSSYVSVMNEDMKSSKLSETDDLEDVQEVLEQELPHIDSTLLAKDQSVTGSEPDTIGFHNGQVEDPSLPGLNVEQEVDASGSFHNAKSLLDGEIIELMDENSFWVFLPDAYSLTDGFDSWINELIDTLPSTIRKLFVNAPLSLRPSVSLLVFSVLCSVVMVILVPVLNQETRRWFIENEELDYRERYFEAENALLIAEQEKTDLRKELELLQAQVKNDELVRELSEQAALVVELHSTIEMQEEELKRFNSENVELRNELLQIKNQASATNADLSELQISLQQSQMSALEMQSQLKAMTDEISILQASKDQLLAEAENCSEKMREMVEELNRLQEEQRLYQEAVVLKDSELEELRSCFSQLKIFEEILSESASGEEFSCTDASEKPNYSTQDRITDLMNVAKVNAKLKTVEEECDSLQRALAIEVESRAKIEEHLKETKEEMSRLMESHRDAEQQANAAQVKMNVLSAYFKEKEKELNRKLIEQDAREKVNADQLINTDVRTKEFEAMVHLYKEQVEDLQNEIRKIEADYRRQIAAQEKKAHENWLAARQSERELKEQKVDAQILRQKVLELQTKLDFLSNELKKAKESGVGHPAANEAAQQPLAIPDERSVLLLRGLPPLIARTRPFFPPPPFLAGDRSPSTVRFSSVRHGPPVPLLLDRRYPSDVRKSPSSIDARASPNARIPAVKYPSRDRDHSPPPIHSSSEGVASPGQSRGRSSPSAFERNIPWHETDRDPSSIVRPLAQFGKPLQVVQDAARSNFQPKTDRPPEPYL